MEEIQDIDIAEGSLTTVSFSQKEYDNYLSGFIVRIYDRNAPSDINAYQQQSFDLTNTFYRSILFPQTDKYFIRALGENTAAVFSHAIALNGEDITAMNMIDLGSQVIWCLGMVHNDKDITIRDVNFSEDKDYVFLIERTYNPLTDDHNDCEIILKWDVGTQTADAFYFDSYSPIRIPLMNTITPITSSKYLSAGLNPNNNTNCFHILDFNNSNGTCEQSFDLNVVPQLTSPTGNTFNGFVQYDNGTCNWLQYYSTNTSTIHTHCSD